MRTSHSINHIQVRQSIVLLRDALNSEALRLHKDIQASEGGNPLEPYFVSRSRCGHLALLVVPHGFEHGAQPLAVLHCGRQKHPGERVEVIAGDVKVQHERRIHGEANLLPIFLVFQVLMVATVDPAAPIRLAFSTSAGWFFPFPLLLRVALTFSVFVFVVLFLVCIVSERQS